MLNSRMETSLPGVSAAGDIVTYPGKIKLIASASGFAEAAIAVEKRSRKQSSQPSSALPNSRAATALCPLQRQS